MKQFLLSTINDILSGSTVKGTLVEIYPRQLAPLYALKHLGQLEPQLFSNEAEIIQYVEGQARQRNQELRKLKVYWTSMTVRYQYRYEGLIEWRNERITIVPFQPFIP